MAMNGLMIQYRITSDDIMISLLLNNKQNIRPPTLDAFALNFKLKILQWDRIANQLHNMQGRLLFDTESVSDGCLKHLNGSLDNVDIH